MYLLGRLFLIALLALVLHLFFGWMTVLLAGVAVGIFARRNGWLWGAAGVGLEWAFVIAWDYAVAPEPMLHMSRMVSAIAGNLPPAGIVLASLLIGTLLGLLGGLAGQAIGALLDNPPLTPPVPEARPDPFSLESLIKKS